MPPQLATNYAADLSSYESACRLDPDLQAFDATVHQRTSRALQMVSAGVEVRSVSFDSLKEVTEVLLEMNQDVAKVILENKKDIWNNQDLFLLVEEYLENSIKTLDFCTTLVHCLQRAKMSQLIIQLAVKSFEDEVQSPNGADGFVKTLEELRRFKDAGEPFTEEFFSLFQSIHKQQILMLEKLLQRKRVLDKKLRNTKTWCRVTNVLFVTAFIGALIFSVVAAAVAAPAVVTAVAAAVVVPIGTVGKWCSQLWNRYENVLRGQRELMSSVQIGTYITIKDMESIRLLVNKFQVQIESMLHDAEFALGEDNAVKLVIDEIRKKLETFMETIEELNRHADKCSRDVRRARTVILQKIIQYPQQTNIAENTLW